MADLLFVRGLEVYCVIGMQTWERQVMQKVRIDLEMEADCRPAGSSDDIARALDYRAVAKHIQKFVEASSYQLVEALAEAIALEILARFPTPLAVKVRVEKPGAVRFSESVGVEIVRMREEGG